MKTLGGVTRALDGDVWRLIRVNRVEEKMLISRIVKVLGMTAVSGVLTTAGVAGADAVIKIDGSSTMYPITEAVAKNFQATQKMRSK